MWALVRIATLRLLRAKIKNKKITSHRKPHFSLCNSGGFRGCSINVLVNAMINAGKFTNTFIMVRVLYFNLIVKMLTISNGILDVKTRFQFIFQLRRIGILV